MRLYDSLTRELHDVSPVDGETVKIYSCGPTVYRYIHIGNMRSFMLGDLIRRALRFEGLEVRWIMNITDVGHMTDEVSDTGPRQDGARRGRRGPLGRRDRRRSTRTRSWRTADLVGIERADLYPRATDHIAEMIKLIRDADREGPRVRGRRERLLRRHDVPRLRQALGQHARPAPRGPPSGGGGRPEQAPPRGLRAVEEGRPQPRPEVAEPVGRRLPRVAHRVLGDVDEAPRRPLRRPHRRQRQQVPPPRGRDRAVRGRPSATRSSRSGCTGGSCRWAGRRWPSPRRTSTA